MKKTLIKKIILISFLASCFLASCTQSNITSSASRDYFSEDEYISNSSQLMVYRQTPTGIEFETELLPNGLAAIAIPKNVLKTSSEDRSKSNIAVPVDLFLKVYTPDSTLPDKYFEIPVLGTPLTPSNVTTALSWILRWSFNSTLLFSKNDFDQTVQEVELTCLSCRKKSTSETVQHILGNSTILISLKNKIVVHNPSLNINSMSYNPPAYEFIYSNQVITSNSTVKQEIQENKNYSAEFIIIDPIKSNEIVMPTSWSREFKTVTSYLNSEKFSYNTSYTDSGVHIIKPIFNSILTNLNIELTVSNINRLPICTNLTALNFSANRITQFALSTICQDPDPEDSSLIYNLKSGPAGLTITSTGNIQWSPSQAEYLANPTRSIIFGVTDPLFGYSEYTLELRITPDGIPSIRFDGPNNILIEGQESTFLISATDIDGDPLLLKVQAVTLLQNGLPIGSSDMLSIVRTGNSGNYSWTWKFTPSFLQTIGANNTVRFKFYATYDPVNPGLDASITLSEIFVDFNLTNMDDPPVWISQPSNFSATENSLVSFSFPADTIDPNPNPSAIAYSLDTPADSDCDWNPSNFVISVVAGNLQLDVTPEYKSKRECFFTLTATDSTGLSTPSASFTIDIIDVNQPISVLPSPPLVLNGLEMQLLDLQIQNMFEDLDFTDGDDYEIISWQCYLDQDQNTLYTDLCSSAGVNLNLNNIGLNGNWLPSAIAAGTYYIRLIVTDKGGAVAQHDFTIIITDSPAPLNLSIVYDGAPSNNLIISENSNNTVTLSVAAATLDPIDNYNFEVLPAFCSVINGSGNCPALLLTPNGNFSGTGSIDFNMDLAPLYADGNANFPTAFKSYSYLFTAYKTDQPSLRTDISFTVRVNNTNRNPTNLTASGCSSCTLTNIIPNPITLTLNAAADNKVGPNWTKTYSTTFAVVDPDPNDLPAVSLAPSSPILGSFAGFAWSFKIPSCVNPSPSGNVVRTLTFRATDGRGGFYDRALTLTIQKATASASCIQ